MANGNSIDVVSVKLNLDYKLFSEDPIETPKDVARLACRMIKDSDRENILIFNLLANGKVSSVNVAGVGTVDSCIAHPRELIKSTLLSNASSIIIAHNHPGGSIDPSGMDISMTARMAKVCNMLEIRLLDHIIVGGGRDEKYMSFLDQEILIKRGDGSIDISDEYMSMAAERSFSYGNNVYDRPVEYGKSR